MISVSNIRPLCFRSDYEELAKRLEISETSKSTELDKLRKQELHVEKCLDELQSLVDNAYSMSPYAFIKSVGSLSMKMRRAAPAKPLTIQDKARIFDNLIEMLEGRHRYAGTLKKPIISQPNVVEYSEIGDPVFRYKEVQCFEWVIHSQGESSFEKALMCLLPLKKEI